jgi:DNA-binding winged helix-turn-helix (wHTH) protein/Tol biopolymer transport system component
VSYGDRRNEQHPRYRFGAFALDLERGFLRHADTDVPLRPKAFDALAYLVAHPGKLVTKAELIAAVWPATSVTDNSLSHCLLEIRRALGDDAQQLIRTVARRGYVFAAPVVVEAEAARPHFGRSAPDPPAPREAVPPVSSRQGWRTAGLLAAPAFALSVLLFLWRAVPPGSNFTYTELTHLTDSATNPALSPDGRMVAFVRGANTFLDTGQVYVQLLPDGEPVQLTRDDHQKMAPAFSPDGLRIAYTVYSESGTWETWTVPVLGGQPQLMMANAAALSWVRDDQVLFSQITRGLHMTVVTATTARADVRDVYVPPTDRMAHRSAASPDGRWVLVSSEMNASGWLPCRLVPMDGSDTGRSVGPPDTPCTHAAWSPDGRWMYFSAATRAGFRTWRQKFPDGTPVQMTHGAAEEEGLALWPDGRSLVSSVGVAVSSVWVHDAGIERQITSEGFAHLPSFSRDGKMLYFLQRVSDKQHWAAGELWAIELAAGTRRRLLPGMSMAQYEVSADDTRVVFARTDSNSEGVWVAQLDGHLPPVRISSQADTRALWGPDGDVIFEERQDQGKYLVRSRADGLRVGTITPDPIINLESVSPDRRWALVWPAGDDRDRMLAYPLDRGPGVQICERCNDGDGGPGRGRTPPSLMWSPDGGFIYARFGWSPSNPALDAGRTYVVTLPHANGLPPPFAGEAGLASNPGVRVTPRWGIFPGPRPTLYAYTQAVTHRNLYRIAISDLSR